jgi:Zn-dependent protease
VQNAIIALAVLIASVIIHENAHGVVALMLGDDTARASGRLTLNPVKHVDFVGSLIFPAIMYAATHSMFGYAKPVPVTPQKLKGTDRWGFATVALAGPVSNLIIAFVAVLALKHTGGALGDVSSTPGVGVGTRILVYAASINLLLASFNLLPIPPLDGSRLIRPALTSNGRRTLDRIEPYGFLILLGLIVWLQGPLFRVISLIESGLVHLLPV